MWLRRGACVFLVTTLLGVGYFANSTLASDSTSCIVEFRKSENSAATNNMIGGVASRISSSLNASIGSRNQLTSDATRFLADDVRSPEKYSIDFNEKSKSRSTKLPQIAKLTLERKFNGDAENIDQFAKHFPVPDPYKKRAGLFVTFSRSGKTRACWGSVYPRFTDLVKATVYTTQEALTNEYRYPKIREDEVASLKAQVTVVKKLIPISSIHGQNPIKFGLMVRSGNKTAVILPGEATDAYYQLVQCKLKAAIPIKQNCQLYRIDADVYI
jgi:AMMECR1 domain-containing protein